MPVIQTAIIQLPILLRNGKLFFMLATLVLILPLICTFLSAFGQLALRDSEPSSSLVLLIDCVTLC